jgi:hypothetical protein
MNMRYTTVALVLMIIFEVVVFQGKPVYRKFGSNCTAASVNLSCFFIRTKVFDLSMPLFLTICWFILLINQSMESLCLMIIFRTKLSMAKLGLTMPLSRMTFFRTKLSSESIDLTMLWFLQKR